MANIKSAKKRIKITKRNRLRNVAIHSRMKTAIKAYYSAVDAKSSELVSVLRETLKIIDKTASKGVIKKQKASRLKSRIMKHFNSNSGEIDKEVKVKEKTSVTKDVKESPKKSVKKTVKKTVAKSSEDKPAAKTVKKKVSKGSKES